ncbi:MULTISPECIES: site-specific integrase [Caproicibacterium]|uniref:Tyrosine-type recombinase/integrase n=1 Tax=Caproicibacterium argilliputei TaxID=3030016 RepID=A0AA97D9G8_9FIRM|nr:site-specific integrase [Caproicibacterium argilliputei]WOC32704.1 tyrosine-type recombinase/integrase [Caproicibacterium argilliputei]
MPRRGENIYKRKDGRWEGRVRTSDGKYRYVYAKTYREVKEKQRLCQETGEVHSLQVLPASTKAAGLFSTWLSKDILYQVKPSTYESYYRCMKKYVIPFFSLSGNEFLSEASAARFARSVQDNSSLSESSKRKILTIFKTSLKGIAKDTHSSVQILESVRLPKEEDSEVLVFTVKEQRQIEHAVFQAGDQRLLGILLCFYTGIRIGELCALRWSDLDDEAGTISVTKTVTRVKDFSQTGSKTKLMTGTPKSRKSMRKIPLPQFLLAQLTACKARCPKDSVYMLSGTAVPIDPRYYQKLYKKLLADAHVKYRKFHAIRHTFATRALELGVDMKTLSELLGHANVSITLNIYAHSLMGQKKIAMEKFNEMHSTCMLQPPAAVTTSVNRASKADRTT